MTQAAAREAVQAAPAADNIYKRLKKEVNDVKTPVTPMMKQYLEIKSEYEDCILFFRLGDFYEMFFEDAIKASNILEITLTGKDCGMEERAPMCGVPFHSVEGYIAKLVKSGLKVAICEQVEDPQTAKGIVKRDVVRVITPGTVNMDVAFSGSDNNFLASVYIDEKGYGVSFADVSTGELITSDGEFEITENQLLNTIACFKPSEIIINNNAAKYAKMFNSLRQRFEFFDSYLQEDYYKYDFAEGKVKEKFKIFSLDQIGLEGKDNCVKSLGAMLAYLEETQKTDLSHISAVKYFKTGECLEIDLNSRRNLELTETLRDKTKRGSLFGILDKTKTAMGTRRLKSWIDRPLISAKQINRRLDAVEELVSRLDIREGLTEALKNVNDIERIISKIVYGTCNARDFIALKNSFEVFPEIYRQLSGCESEFLKSIFAEFDVMGDLQELIESAIVDDPPLTIREGGMIKKGFDAELDKLSEIVNHGSGYLAQLEVAEKEKTGIKNLKISFNKVFGYYIEVSNSQKDKVPDNYIRKQTLVNAERFITQELKEIENTILGSKERVNNLEYEDFMYVKGEIGKDIERLQKCAKLVSVTDVLCSLANVAVSNDYLRPQINESDIIDIKDGRHPIVEKYLTDTFFVPNDTYLDIDDSMVSIITGPNMAGKSTYMRQTALIVLMAQIGSFVPAKSANIGVVDKIFTRVGASDDLASGQSTFMVEMNEVANILKNATNKSLIILDEIGRGTSTYDGLSIAWADAEYIGDKEKIGAKTIFATHYHELIKLEDKMDCIKNYSIAVKKRGDDITFLRKIVKGGTDDSFGIQVALLAGVPEAVTDRAKQILASIEADNPKKDLEIADNSVSTLSNNNNFINNDIAQEILNIDVTTLTPIEAMNELYKLQKKVSELNEN